MRIALPVAIDSEGIDATFHALLFVQEGHRGGSDDEPYLHERGKGPKPRAFNTGRVNKNRPQEVIISWHVFLVACLKRRRGIP